MERNDPPRRPPALPSEEDEEIIELVEEVAEEQDRAAAERGEIAPPGLPALDLSGLDGEDTVPDAQEIELLEVEEGAPEDDRVWLEELERELLPPDSLTNDDPSKTAVRRAIEEAVAREIERVKRLILEEDPDAEA